MREEIDGEFAYLPADIRRSRQKSDESTSVGLKCFRAKVDFPQPEGPMSITSESSGTVSFI
jgi:hypothetical protein